MHCLYLPDIETGLERIEVRGDEAKHATRVKRVRTGEAVRVLNGRGLVLECTVESESKPLLLNVLSETKADNPTPRIEVWAAAPKGSKASEMVDGLSQAGAAMWVPLRTTNGFGAPTDEKLARLERVAAEAAKQCGRAWILEIGPPGTIKEALHCPRDTVVIAGRIGGGLFDALAANSTPPKTIRLLVGPEGGWTREEIAQMESGGARLCSLGRHTLRIELAAVVGTAAIAMGSA